MSSPARLVLIALDDDLYYQSGADDGSITLVDDDGNEHDCKCIVTDVDDVDDDDECEQAVTDLISIIDEDYVTMYVEEDDDVDDVDDEQLTLFE